MAQDKFILIISQESEKSTDDVMKYLHYYNSAFVRINGSDIVNKLKISFDDSCNFSLQYDSQTIESDQIKSVWYRRGKIALVQNRVKEKLSIEEQNLYRKYIEFYETEISAVLDYLHYSLKGVKHINSQEDNHIGKLRQLSVAKRHGFNIPKSLVSNTINDLSSFSSGQPIILKSLTFPIFNIGSTTYQSNFSVLLDENIIQNAKQKYADKNYLISFFQEYIDKKIEIRSYYLFGKIYSMAIFSQQNEKTKIDFRNYDHDRPNRTVPYQLPADIEEKIAGLMNELKLTSGSLDFIYTKDKEYIFLEVNPVGQYDWLSHDCNYHLDKIIAKELMNELE